MNPRRRHAQRMLIGHSRGAAGRLLGIVRIAGVETAAGRRELVEQLELAREDVELALGFARELARARPARR